MPRTIPIPPPQLRAPELTTWTLKLRTITPMFGGSATPREVDPKNPVRAASVRGHLRFWWRATAGAQYASAEELFKAEEEIWGSDASPGKVSIRVLEASASAPTPCCTYHHPRREGGTVLKTYPYFDEYPGYALFPFQGKTSKNDEDEIHVVEEPSKCLTSVEFVLNISAPKAMKSQVWNALLAWITFGGVGSRTRRGCGSIELIENHLDNIAFMTSQGRQIVTPLTKLPVLYFIRLNKQKQPFTHAVEAWKDAVEVYKDFRQSEKFAREIRTHNKKPAGRSKYPEPDTIRQLFPELRWKRQPRSLVRGFPRADLGLPIVFHFSDEGPKESFSLELQNEGHKRLASPVITKAVKIQGGYAAAIVLLESPHVWDVDDLILTLPPDKNGRRQKKSVQIPREQVRLSSVLSSIPPLNGKPIREALVSFIKSKGFKEVRL